MAEDPDSEILLELNRIGGAIEVRAVSAGDGLEVAFTVPVNAAQEDMERLARAKLAYVRSRGSGQGGQTGGDGKGGIVV
jgi:hypothetical protein